MTRSMSLGVLSVIAAALLVPVRAEASFHLMQIEQVIGGVDGDTTGQAIQLRMRSFGQNFVSQGRLVAYDATGANPVTLIDFAQDVPNGQQGDRVLITSASFAKYASPTLKPDFILTNLIPSSYLAAGRITYEDKFTRDILWSLGFGGAAYTGSNIGASINDADGNFGPPFGGPLPSSALQALQFKGTADALSTNNAADYALTVGAAVVTNNARQSFTVVPGLVLALATNHAAFTPGGSLSVSVSIGNPGLPANVDFYFGALLPDGDTVVAFTDLAFDTAVARLSSPATLKPIVAGVSLASPFTFSQPTFFTYQWKGTEPPGSYILFLAAVKSGALMDNSIDNGDILAMSLATITFGP